MRLLHGADRQTAWPVGVLDAFDELPDDSKRVHDARNRTARLVASVTTIQDEKLADVRAGQLIRVVLHAEQGDLLPLIDAHVAGDDPPGAAGSGAVANPNAATAAAAAIRPFGSLLISPIASDVNFDLPSARPVGARRAGAGASAA